MKVISLANQKGGCGKTITAVNLAGALAAIGKKVLFIDLDPQSHGTSSFGIKSTDVNTSTYALFDSYLKGQPINLLSLIHPRYENLWVLGSHISLSTIEQKMSGSKEATTVIKNLLKQQEAASFDYVIIDTPPTLGFLTFNAVHASNMILVPIDTSLFSMNGVEHIREILKVSTHMGFEKPSIKFLLTSYDGRSNFAKKFMEEARTRYGSELLPSFIRPNIKLREAAQAGKVIFEYDPKANGAKDYTSLLNELFPSLKADFITLKKSRETSTTGELPKIIFKVDSPMAQEVYLAGTFNNWIVNKTSLMKKLENGTWVKILTLPEGDYRYKFVIDGKWVEDPANELSKENEFGGKDSILMVKSGV